MKNTILTTCLLSVFINSSCAQSAWLESAIDAKTPQTNANASPQKEGRGFFSNHQLVLFFSSRCPYCLQFAPVLKAWSSDHQAPLLALSFDNQPMPEFPNFEPVSTEWVTAAFAGGAINYPALFIVNTTTHVLYPVSTGLLSPAELDERMKAIAPKVLAYEQRGAV